MVNKGNPLPSQGFIPDAPAIDKRLHCYILNSVEFFVSSPLGRFRFTHRHHQFFSSDNVVFRLYIELPENLNLGIISMKSRTELVCAVIKILKH